MNCDRIKWLLANIETQAKFAWLEIQRANSTGCYEMLKGIRLDANEVQNELASVSATILKVGGDNDR